MKLLFFLFFLSSDGCLFVYVRAICFATAFYDKLSSNGISARSVIL